MPPEQIEKARNLAKRWNDGESLAPHEYQLVNKAIDEIGPENFFMDGELFFS